MQQLIGAWKLLFINVTGGTSTYGDHPLGRIIFTSEGYMNAMVTNPTKSLPNGTSWAQASDHQIATIAKQMVAYSGPYTVQNVSGEIYTHVNVEISMNPSWLGTDQVRHASFEEKDGRSLLSLIPMSNGTKSTSTLVWEKIVMPTPTTGEALIAMA